MNMTPELEQAMKAHRDTVDAQIARAANRRKYQIEIPEQPK